MIELTTTRAPCTVELVQSSTAFFFIVHEEYREHTRPFVVTPILPSLFDAKRSQSYTSSGLAKQVLGDETLVPGKYIIFVVRNPIFAIDQGGNFFISWIDAFGIASISILCVIFIAILYRKIRHKWRQMHRLCCSCGYDLGGVGQQCPECGNVCVSRRVAQVDHVSI